MKADININPSKFEALFDGIKFDQLQITIDNIGRLDDLHDLKHNGNLRQEIVQNLLVLNDDNYLIAINHLENIPNFKL